jgi:L-ribulose-5-phosphate 4-epimerase
MYEDLKEKLVNGGRALALEGQGDYVAGHISVRLPDDPNKFLMKPAGIGLEEMNAGNIITVDIEGRKIDGVANRHNEVYIHSEILRARPDVNSVIHTHPIHAVVFSSLDKPLQMVGNDSSNFHRGLPVFSETTDLITTQERGRGVAQALGDHPAVLLRNHGIAVGGNSIEQAVWLALKLERACQMQLMAESAGGAKVFVKPEDIGDKAKKSNRPDLNNNVFSYLVRKWKRHMCPMCAQEDVEGPRTFKVETGTTD